MKCDYGKSYKFPSEGLLKDTLAKAAGALEVGGHHRLQLLHHAQSPLHFRHDPLLLGERWQGECELRQLRREHVLDEAAAVQSVYVTTESPGLEQIQDELRKHYYRREASEPLIQQASFVLVGNANPAKELVPQRLRCEIHHQFAAAHNQIWVLFTEFLGHTTRVVLGLNDFAANMEIAGPKEFESCLLVFSTREWPTVL